MPRLDTSEACRDRSMCDGVLLLAKRVPLYSIHDIAMLSGPHPESRSESLLCPGVPEQAEV